MEQDNSLDGMEIIDDDSFNEEDSQYNFRELFDSLMNSKDLDLIFTVPDEHVDALKQGLIKRKSKDNLKLKASGLKPDDKSLNFLVYRRKDKNGREVPGEMDVRVRLRPRRGVKILDMRAPDDL